MNTGLHYTGTYGTKMTEKAHHNSKSPLDANFSEIHSGTSSCSNLSCSSTSPANNNQEDLAWIKLM